MRPFSPIFIPWLYLCLAAAQDSVPRCYYPDGTIASNDYACRLNTTESFCCTTNVTCLDNKICAVLEPTQYKYNRGTCTDKTWTSDACPNFCIAKAPDYGSGVIRCPSTSEVCCDNGNKDATATCCQDNSNLFALAGDWDVFRTINGSAATAVRSVVSTSSEASTSSPPASTSAPNLASAMPANTSQANGNQSVLSTGGIVGVVFGIVFGIGLLSAVALWHIRRRKRNASARSRLLELDGMDTRYELSARESRHELSAKEAPHELSSGEERHELEVSPMSNLGGASPQEMEGSPVSKLGEISPMSRK